MNNTNKSVALMILYTIDWHHCSYCIVKQFNAVFHWLSLWQIGSLKLHMKKQVSVHQMCVFLWHMFTRLQSLSDSKSLKYIWIYNLCIWIYNLLSVWYYYTALPLAIQLFIVYTSNLIVEPICKFIQYTSTAIFFCPLYWKFDNSLAWIKDSKSII